MRKLKFIPFLLILFLLSNCERKISNVEIEKKIMNELFVEMVDSIHKDPRIYLTFPPYPEKTYDENGNVIKIDSTEYKKKIVIFNLKQEQIKKDTSKLVIGVNEKIHKPRNFESEIITEYFDKLMLKIDTTDSPIEYEIDINNFKNNPKFKFKYLSEFPKRGQISNVDGSFIFSGGVSFSKIIFDKKKSIGIISVSYICEPRCGVGYLIILVKKGNKWIIQEIKQTWIS